jgi:putative addiction module killer protein
MSYIQCEYELRHYVNRQGRDLFAHWLDGLKDSTARARVAARLTRLANGNFGDCKPVGSGVWELRVDWGPGYRVYYAIERQQVILLCHGGDKRSQVPDIKEAIRRWQQWQKRGRP